jgi:hypothetical protein
MLKRIQRRHRSEQRALEGAAHTAQSSRGVAASANLGGPQVSTVRHTRSC